MRRCACTLAEKPMGAEQATALERRVRAAIAVVANTVDDDVEQSGHH
jgi:hypothetical protein